VFITAWPAAASFSWPLAAAGDHRVDDDEHERHAEPFLKLLGDVFSDLADLVGGILTDERRASFDPGAGSGGRSRHSARSNSPIAA
jgi:hypothetical protein